MNDIRKSGCPDCAGEGFVGLSRRQFLTTASAAGAAALGWVPSAPAAPSTKSQAETTIAALYQALTPAQRKVICFPWDHRDPKRGLLRTFVANNWHITEPAIAGDFFTKSQQGLIRDAFRALFSEGWYVKFLKQLEDDTDGHPWGTDQNIALFGEPGSGKFQMVMTGRHLTVRADGNSEKHVALGGPIFHGHAASGFNEKVGHPGNIFWHQAVLANQVFDVLDGSQIEKALVSKRPREQAVAFRKDRGFPGVPIAELAADQVAAVRRVLESLIEPYRQEDRDEVMHCLDRQGGLAACSLAFYKDGDIGDDGQWDNWRLEGPSLVWYFRGSPHVHIWINVADDPSVPLNA